MNDEDLRRLLEVQDSQPDSSQNEEACPDPEELWALVSSELETARTQEILDHALHCERCREALTIARLAAAEGAAEAEGGLGRAPAASSSSRWVAVAGSIAAILVVAILFNASREDRALDADRTRTVPAGEAVWVDLSADEPISRSDIRLRWKPIDHATDYVVEVYSPDLDLILRSGRLTEPTLPIAGESIPALADTDTLLWRVEARLASGDLERSPVFRAELVRDEYP